MNTVSANLKLGYVDPGNLLVHVGRCLTLSERIPRWVEGVQGSPGKSQKEGQEGQEEVIKLGGTSP